MAKIKHHPNLRSVNGLNQPFVVNLLVIFVNKMAFHDTQGTVAASYYQRA